MSASFRQFAVSGSAAVALLGGAAAITFATPSPASAATQSVAVNAVTAPVQMPDGRTVRITGMGGYGHHATTEQVAAVAAFKTDTNPTANPGVGTGLTPDGGAGAAITNPVTGTQTGYNQQIVTQSAGGAIGVGVVAILVLAIVVFYKVKHGGMKAADAVIGGLFGLALSGTVVGAMGTSLTNSLVGSLGSMLGGLG
ncbi:hypothetical protein ACIRU8_39365 [Streptomyces sp. NPDC101175]|uniref:hypothetical protein n=1 Tax=Streptomyces sp. NPDC101175 TaxID=3366123 RepID=UPI0038386BC5